MFDKPQTEHIFHMNSHKSREARRTWKVPEQASEGSSRSPGGITASLTGDSKKKKRTLVLIEPPVQG